MKTGNVELSVVAPLFNERGNLERLFERVSAALDGRVSWELVLVDDGSRDGSADVIGALKRADPRVNGVFLDRNRGQTTALLAGIEHARGALVATLDADLQNDPQDLVRMLWLIETCDAVVGVRRERHDSWLRRASSRVANRIRDRVLGDRVRDSGCALRLMRREAACSIPRFEGMHRFLPTLLRWSGYTVVEAPVAHYERTWGRSKYGVWNRLWRTAHDILVVRWMRSRLIRPDVLAPGGRRPAPRRNPPAGGQATARRAAYADDAASRRALSIRPRWE